MDLVKLANDLDELESRRKSLRNSIIISGIVFFCFVAFYLFAGVVSAYSNFIDAAATILPFLSVVSALGFGLVDKAKKRRYKKLYNAVIVRSILDNYFEITDFNSDYGIPKNVIEKTKMIKMGNTYSADDYVEGSYKGLPFYQSDVCIQDVHSNGKTTTTITFFKGRWMVFDFNKNFLCDMLVHERSFSYANHRHGLFNNDKSFQSVEFENMNFNKNFKTYSNNQQEAFYIMSPHMMESILNLQNNTKGDLILCFKNNQLHVGVNNHKNAFEPPIFHPIDIASASRDIGNDIDLITRFVDELRLDENVYKA